VRGKLACENSLSHVVVRERWNYRTCAYFSSIQHKFMQYYAT
jgi:hypothetical protein